MKKWIVAIIVVLVAAFIFLNFVLPSPGKVTVNKHIKASTATIYRVIANQQRLDRVLPGDFTLTKKLLNSVHINTTINNKVAPGNILIVFNATDSSLVSWECAVPEANGFFSSISRRMLRNELENKLTTALESIDTFSTNPINTYGMNIIQTSTKDTSLLVTRFQTSAYPTNQEIYSHIDKLIKFAATKNAAQTGYPMLNVSTTDSITFRCMVALPVNREIETAYDAPISFVHMVPGRFLTAEIKGGPYTIQRANEMMQLYFQDYKRTAMAIPFEYLVTSRLNETDTSKWITRIYAPVY